MNGYIGSNNIAQKIKNIYVGVNDTARKVKKGYVGIDGIAEQFYKSTDTWNRYNYNATINGYSQSNSNVTSSLPVRDSRFPTVKWLTKSGGTIYSQGTTYVCINYSFNSSTGIYSSTNSRMNVSLTSPSMASYPYVITNSSDSEMLYCATSDSGYQWTVDYSTYQFRVDTSVVTVYRYTSYVSSYSYSCGSYIDTVEADEGTYPDNGISGSYWYIKQ